MSDLDEELSQLIARSEDHRIDFKRSDKLDDKEGIAKHLTAFANREGGKLVFGITDNREIEGSEILEEVNVGIVSKVARTRCSPPVEVSHRFFSDQTLDGVTGDVLVIDISARRDVPHAVIERNSGLARKYYIRTGNESRPISNSQEIEQLYRGHVDPDLHESNTFRTGLNFPDLGTASLHPQPPTAPMYHYIFDSLSNTDIDFLTSDIVSNTLGPITYYTTNSDEKRAPLTRYLLQMSPLLLLNDMSDWGIEYTGGHLERSADGESEIKPQYDLHSLTEFQLPDGEPPILDDMDLEYQSICDRLPETSNLTLPADTEILISFEDQTRSRLNFFKEDSFYFSVIFTAPMNALEIGLPPKFPGYLTSGSENEIITPMISVSVAEQYLYPDQADPLISTHREFGQELAEYVENLDWYSFCDEIPHSEIYSISEQLDAIEEKLDN